MDQTFLFHAQADAVVDDGGAADDAALKHDDIPVGGGLQGAVLEQPSGHPRFFQSDPGGGIMTTGLYDQGFVPLVGNRGSGDGPARARTDHDHVAFLRHGVITDEHSCREIPTWFASDLPFTRGGAVSLSREFEIKVRINRIVEILLFVPVLPMAIIAGQNDSLGTGDVLEQINPGFLQPAPDQLFPDSGRGQQKKESPENEQQTIKRHADLCRLPAFDIGEMLLQIGDHLIGGNGHFAIVKQGLRHRLDHQRLQSIERFPQIRLPRCDPGLLSCCSSPAGYGCPSQCPVHRRLHPP